MKAINLKMICGIIATVSIVVISFFSLSSFWFWTWLEITAGGLVAGGCWGEWYLFKNPPDEGEELQKLNHRRKELQFIICVAIGVTLEFASLSHAIPEAIRLEKDVAEIGTTNAQLVAENLVLQTNVESLSVAVIKLAHLYDQSTNALAEANSRLASVRPIKERLKDCLNEIDSTILTKLAGGKTTFDLETIDFKFSPLLAIWNEPKIEAYVHSFKFNPNLHMVNGMRLVRFHIEIDPQLLK